MKTESGYSFYGQHIGVLVFSGCSPRIPGDPGHNATFSFPVCYATVEGSFMALVREDPAVKAELLQAVQQLKNQGVRAVAGDCGLMSLYQQELADIGLPVAASSLSQIPMLWHMIGKQGRIGIITGHSKMLHSRHLTASGCDGIPVAIQGMEDEPHFSRIVIYGGLDLDPAAMERDVVHAAQLLMQNNPDVRTIVLECSNLATYARAVNTATGLPVFDIISAIKFLEYGVNPPHYNL